MAQGMIVIGAELPHCVWCRRNQESGDGPRGGPAEAPFGLNSLHADRQPEVVSRDRQGSVLSLRAVARLQSVGGMTVLPQRCPSSSGGLGADPSSHRQHNRHRQAADCVVASPRYQTKRPRNHFGSGGFAFKRWRRCGGSVGERGRLSPRNHMQPCNRLRIGGVSPEGFEIVFNRGRV